jgi:hypothetical protein
MNACNNPASWQPLLTAAPIFISALAVLTAIAAAIVGWRNYKAVQQENNKNAFYSLLLEIERLPTSQWPAGKDQTMEEEFNRWKQNNRAPSNSELLRWAAKQLSDIPKQEHFGRTSLFYALKHLYDYANRSQRVLFRFSLNARIGDERARFLILQAIAEEDEDTLEVFGKFPLAFENLHRMRTLQKEIVHRFAKKFEKEILQRTKSMGEASKQ